MCETCWITAYAVYEGTPHFRVLVGLSRTPVRVLGTPIQLVACCWCNAPTISGIRVRANPKDPPKCGGHSE